jgi:hypothetical protein
VVKVFGATEEELSLAFGCESAALFSHGNHVALAG